MSWMSLEPVIERFDELEELVDPSTGVVNMIRIKNSHGTAELPLKDVQLCREERIVLIPGWLPWYYEPNREDQENDG